jgi:membrane fusion protein (multidrug efflux system)
MKPTEKQLFWRRVIVSVSGALLVALVAYFGKPKETAKAGQKYGQKSQNPEQVMGGAPKKGRRNAENAVPDSNNTKDNNAPKRLRVQVERVTNRTVDYFLEATGKLVAEQKIEIFAEYSGVFLSSAAPFREGNFFNKGAVLFKLDDSEIRTQLQAKKNSLLSALYGALADIKIDFPKEYDKWQVYVAQFDLEKIIAPFPDFSSEKEKMFFVGKQIFTQYYDLKNLEAKWQKYTFHAPFAGYISEGNINPGTLVRAGQKLGEFIAMDNYTLRLFLSPKYIDALHVGESVRVRNPENNKTYPASIIRINKKVDDSQTALVSVAVKGTDLYEGLFLHAEIKASPIQNAYSLPSNVLFDKAYVYVVEADSTLQFKKVELVEQTKNRSIVKGLPDGTKVITQNTPGLSEGKKVTFKD